MRIYRYHSEQDPRPECVEDGGYAIDEKGYVLGFGTQPSESEITPEEAVRQYDALGLEPDEDTGEEPLTAQEWLSLWDASPLQVKVSKYKARAIAKTARDLAEKAGETAVAAKLQEEIDGTTLRGRHDT
jgi:hypothetical protein